MRTLGVISVTLLTIWVTTPVGAQELERGTWTGTLSVAGTAITLTYEVGETDGALSIVMSWPEEGLSTAFSDLKLDGDELTFWVETDGRFDCRLLRKEDGSFEGACTDGSGRPNGEGTLTMLPPSGDGP